MLKLALVVLAFALLTGCQAMSDCCKATGECCKDAANAAGCGGHIGHLRHVVFFKFKPETTPEKIKEIETAFALLPGKIPAIIDFEWGTDVGVENLSQGYTHCFLVTFKDAKGRDEYLPHPEHKKFVDLAKPWFDGVHVIDYVAR